MPEDHDMDSILSEGSRLGDYTVVRRLDHSGRAYRNVYLASDRNGDKVVLTVYDKGKTPMVLFCEDSTFVREVKAAIETVSPVFAKYLKSGLDDVGDVCLAWFVTTYVDGPDLESYVENTGPLSMEDVQRFLYRLVEGESELQVVFRKGGYFNLCPENIRVQENPDGGVDLFLVGLDCASDSTRGKTLADPASLQYNCLAPESFMGIFNERSEIFSIGVLLYYMLSGVYPWEPASGEGMDISSVKAEIIKRRKHSPDMNKIPENVRTVIGQALRTRRSDRQSSYVELLSDFSDRSGVRISFLEDQKLMPDVSAESVVRIEKVEGQGLKAVAGMSALKERLVRDFVDILRNETLASRFRIAPPNGLLLYGPPGCGKTFIAQQTAEEAGLEFSLIKPSDIGSIYVHGAQGMIADIFAKAEKKAPVMLCFDEFDAMVPAREMSSGSNTNNEVNEFLVQMNNCSDRGIYIMAMTNRPDIIDRAVLRKGRIDECIYVPLPDIEARKGIFSLELENRLCDSGIDLGRLADMTSGYTCSDIAYIVQESARIAFRKSLAAEETEVFGISQNVLESVIKTTMPSVNQEDMSRYERLEKEMTGKASSGRKRIGFMM